MAERMDTMLTVAGRARREAMLRTLTHAMRERHAARRRRRRAAAAGGGLLLFALAAVAGRGVLREPATVPGRLVEVPAPMVPERPPARPESSAPRVACVIEVVKTDPTIVDRYRAPQPQRVRVQWIDDDALLAELRGLDRPTGLVRVNGRAFLTEVVVDEPS